MDFKIMPEVATNETWLVFFISYFTIFLLFYKLALDNSYNREISLQRNASLFFAIAIFSICACYTGDFAHYQLSVISNDTIHLESVYHYIIDFINGNYLAFRIIIWGGGLIVLLFTFKNFKIDSYRALFFLFAIYITIYSYARASLAMSIYFLGISILFSKHVKFKLVKLLLGLLLVLSSFFFHRSMIVMILLTPFAFLHITRNTIKFFIILLVIMFFIINSRIGTIFQFLMFNEDLGESIEIYTNIEDNEVGMGIIAKIATFFSHLSLILPIIVSLKYVLFVKNQVNINNSIQYLARISTVLLWFVIIMFFLFGIKSPFFFRYENMLFIPVVIMINYLYQYHILSDKSYKRVFGVCSVYEIYYFAYHGLFPILWG